MKTIIAILFCLPILHSSGQTLVVKLVDDSGRPAPGISVYIAAPGCGNVFNVATTADDGTARLGISNYDGRNELVVQARVTDGKKIKIEAGPIEGALNSFASEDTLPFYGSPDAQYKLDDYVRFTTMEDVLREYVSQVGLRKRSGRLTPFVFDEIRRKPFGESPLLLVNGVPVFDVQHLLEINPQIVVDVHVVSSRYFFFDQVFDGIINVITRDYSIGDIPLADQALILRR